ncbi:hypothetical protein [Streptomyces sp. CB02959]|uniref:aromatic-ring hydroxylase C-terminal domain-containing protein n=1 Tax=Streptomyces sp. CB02959 TaxID=2020330 RepID=UPI0035B51959
MTPPTSTPPVAAPGNARGDAADLTGLLIRPDGYVAWACGSPRPDPGELAALRTAAERWFGV